MATIEWDGATRIEQLLKILDISRADFIRETGLKRSVVAHALIDDRAISKDVAKSIINKYPNINSEWLLEGKGDIFHVVDWRFISDHGPRQALALDEILATLVEEIREIKEVIKPLINKALNPKQEKRII